MAGIVDLNGRSVMTFGGSQPDHAALVGILHRVVQQDGNHLADGGAVSPEGQSVGNLLRKLLSLCPRHGGKGF